MVSPIQLKPYSMRHIFRFVHRKTSAIVDSTRECLLSCFYSHDSGCFSFLPVRRPSPLLFSLTQHSFILSLSLNLSSFLRYLCMSPKSKKFTLESATGGRDILEQFFKNISSSRFSSLPLLVRARGPKWNGGWKFTRHRLFALRLALGLTKVEARSSAWCGS